MRCDLHTERPKLLRSCLMSVCEQRVPDGVAVEIVVVENHDKDVSRPITVEVAAQTGWTIHYVLEPELGIPSPATVAGCSPPITAMTGSSISTTTRSRIPTGWPRWSRR
ncbi:MAG: glycosyltransferase [Alphaproteobacteria bacterium]|nr:glycosyltransferase [Alphaproteobacteria bacterium]